MKRFTVLLMAVLGLLLSGCDAFRTLSDKRLPASLGTPYELIVVCPQNDWTGELGDTIRKVFTAPVPYLNQTEPLFDVLRVLPDGFTNMVVKHRNILKVVVDPAIAQAGIAVQYDLEAAPQIVMTLQGPDEKAVTDYLSAHREEAVYALEKAERDRALAYAGKFGEPHLQEVMRQRFGVEMRVPKGYVLAADQPDFVWARYEYPAASQGFFAYSYPYEGKQSLSEEALLAARNRFAARIPGPSDGSYMTTSPVIEPAYRMFRMEGRIWVELRGFWDVEGDFMGGPFVSYTTVDKAAGRIFTLDCYVYSPKLHKRNFVRGVEHLLYGIEFPQAEPAEKTLR